MNEEHARSDARSFGVKLLLGADALFFFALLYAYGHMRVQLGVWPHPEHLARVDTPWPLAAAFLLAAASVFHLRGRRRGGSLAPPLFATAGALAALVLVWRAALAGGLRPADGRYAFVVFASTGLLALHVLGACIGLAARVAQGETAAETPWLGLFLAYLAALSAVVVGAVFLW